MTLRQSSSFTILTATTFALAIHAPIASAADIASGKVYVGIFGGGGTSNDFDGRQYATAFFPEANGGPLSVNAFGEINNRSAAFFGAQLGYQAQEICLTSQWTLGPAIELEGFAMNKRSFEGEFINDTARLPEHDFLVSYPTKRTMFLANAVINFNHPCLQVHPYISFGIGNAIIRISDASATQISPPEVGVNHYNSYTSDTTSAFAGQIKLGLNYDINNCINLFAEYRWLYLASTDFIFGSTVYPAHVETSSWQVNLDAQRYNLGNVGIRFNW